MKGARAPFICFPSGILPLFVAFFDRLLLLLIGLSCRFAAATTTLSSHRFAPFLFSPDMLLPVPTPISKYTTAFHLFQSSLRHLQTTPIALYLPANRAKPQCSAASITLIAFRLTVSGLNVCDFYLVSNKGKGYRLRVRGTARCAPTLSAPPIYNTLPRMNSIAAIVFTKGQILMGIIGVLAPVKAVQIAMTISIPAEARYTIRETSF